MAAAFPLEPPNQDTASASKSDKLLADRKPFNSRQALTPAKVSRLSLGSDASISVACPQQKSRLFFWILAVCS
jgi:hypothetical protein